MVGVSVAWCHWEEMRFECIKSVLSVCSCVYCGMEVGLPSSCRFEDCAAMGSVYSVYVCMCMCMCNMYGGVM